MKPMTGIWYFLVHKSKNSSSFSGKTPDFCCSSPVFTWIKKDFVSDKMNEKEILDVIKEVYEKHKIILDPHSGSI